MVYRLDEADEPKFMKFLNEKYKIIYEIGTSTGLRISDIITLKKTDIKRRPYIKQKKTGKVKRVYLGKKIIKRINNIINGDLTGSIYVFHADGSEEPLTRQAVYKAFEKARKEAGIKYAVGTHCMRKGYAKAAYDNTHSINTVKRRLQHEHLSDSILYLNEFGKENNNENR